VAAGSPMVRRRVAELQFRARYKAAIVAVHRHATVIDWYNCQLLCFSFSTSLLIASGLTPSSYSPKSAAKRKLLYWVCQTVQLKHENVVPICLKRLMKATLFTISRSRPTS
jgi:hypothetical protein